MFLVIFIAGALLFLFYLCAIPVQFAVSLQLSERNGFGTALSLFERRFALRSASLRASGLKKHLPRKRKRFVLKNAADAIKPARYSLRHARFEGLELRGTIATGDAAGTALLCGSLESLKYILAPLAPAGKITICVAADFSSSVSRLQLNGMFSMRAGHIIGSALLLAANYIKRRFRIWKDIRLKIS